jgi:hypothetical protein
MFMAEFDSLTTILGAAVGMLIVILWVGRIISRWRPDHIFSILLFSILMGAVPISLGSKTPNLYFSDLVVVFLLARLFIGRLLSRPSDDRLPPADVAIDIQLFALIAILYLLFVLFSIGISPDPLRSLADIKVLIESLFVFLLVWLSLRDDPEAIQNVMRTTTILGLTIAILTLVTTYHACQGYLGLMFKWTKSYEIKQSIRLWIGGSNYLGGILAILIPIAVADSFLSRGLRRLFHGAAGLVMLAAIYVTSSSGSMQSLILGTCLVTLLSLSWRSRLVASFIVLIGSAMVLSHPEVWNEIYNKYLYSLQRREEALWLEGWKALIASPLLGIGRGISRTLYGRNLHNSILTAFVESGMFAGILFIILLVLVMRRGVLASRRTRGDRELSLLARGLQISVAVGIIHSLGEILLEATVYAIVFWLIVAMLYALPSARDQPTDNRCVSDVGTGMESRPRNPAAQSAPSGECSFPPS